MNHKVLRVLEYYKIIEHLVNQAVTTIGKERAKDMYPLLDLFEVNQALAATEEGQLVYRLKGLIPLGGLRDIRESIKRASVGGVLNETELLDVAETVMASRRLKKFIQDIAARTPIPILEELSGPLVELKALEDEIRNAIDDNGGVSDYASLELRQIRSEIRSLQSRMKDRLDGILRSPTYQKMMQDPIVTLRNDRYCIPIKSEYKGSFDGIVHDQSASGATFFIEPMSVVSISNQIREVQIREQREVYRILSILSGQVQQHASELSDGQLVIGEIDFIFAKAALAREYQAILPKMNDRGEIRLVKARHPLLDKSKAVATGIELGTSFNLLLITGPNTGGKTVSLKTVGLLTLMAMSGLHVPADEGTELSTFDQVYADIGDEQSIEQSLSTFSGHMKNIIHILEKVDFRSLVLLDELGAGTDPTEGAALAMAILDFLLQRGIRTIATTHYSELKAYAYNQPGAMNASMEFDVETLSPTYRLLIGVPGRSNAFAISQRLGLQSEIIEHAKSKLSGQDLRVEDLIRKLEQQRSSTEKMELEVQQLRHQAERQLAQVESDRQKLEEERERLLAEAEERAQQILKKAEREAAQVIDELMTIRVEQQDTFKEHQLIELRKRLQDAAPTRRERRAQIKSAALGSGAVTTTNQRIEPGDTVMVLTLQQKGTVLEVDGRTALVQIGAMKTKIARDSLQFISKPSKETRGMFKRSAESRIGIELDIRGATIDEAIPQIDKYLDDAIMAGLSNVSIIHGKGTGALRKGVREFLQSHSQVKSFRYGVHGEGGDGVTIVSI